MMWYNALLLGLAVIGLTTAGIIITTELLRRRKENDEI